MTPSTLDAVFGTDHQGHTFRVSDPMSYAGSLMEWRQLDDDRRAGLLPQWRLFEVRSVWVGPDRPLVGPEVRSHDRYDNAPVAFVSRVASSRGFGRVEDAARVAWKAFAPNPRKRRVMRRVVEGVVVETVLSEQEKAQGYGGWFYYANGTTAAQGLTDLARLCQRKGLVVQGGDGRWYPVRQTVEPAKASAEQMLRVA